MTVLMSERRTYGIIDSHRPTNGFERLSEDELRRIEPYIRESECYHHLEEYGMHKGPQVLSAEIGGSGKAILLCPHCETAYNPENPNPSSKPPVFSKQQIDDFYRVYIGSKVEEIV